MKKSALCLTLIFLLGCENKNTSEPGGVKYFNSENLSKLNLAAIENYWDDGITIDTSFYMGANFEDHDGFIEGIRLYSHNGKAIWVSVFNTQEDAINAMELRINDVACVIIEGNEIDYRYKYSNRDVLNSLFEKKGFGQIVFNRGFSAHGKSAKRKTRLPVVDLERAVI